MEISTAVAALAALAQETRLAIFRLLVQAGPDGLAAGAIAERLRAAPATLSFHLAQLSHAGLVTSVRHGRSIVYAPDFEAMRALVGYLTENCCGRRQELCGPACPPSRSPRPGVRADEKAARPRLRSRS